MEATVKNWKQYIRGGGDRCLVGFIKGTDLLEVHPVHAGSDSLERLSLASEGLDFDYCLILHSANNPSGTISGHGKITEDKNSMYDWHNFDPNTFEIIPPKKH